MLTTDLSLRFDPVYEKISRRFLEHPEEFEAAFARAWFKLTHRDMGPLARYLGPDVPKEVFLWQDPIPERDHALIEEKDVVELKAKILGAGLTISELVSTAWASASSFRGTDKRGGANGGRLRLDPQRNWEVNNPSQLQRVLSVFEKIQQEFNAAQTGNKKVSLADLIVLGGCAGVVEAAKRAGHHVTVPFSPGRMDASQDDTDVESFGYLEPLADGFRNYRKPGVNAATEELLIDKANLLTLSVSETTALLGGMRMLETNYDGSRHGVFTTRPGQLTNDFFVNLLDMRTSWSAISADKELFEGKDRSSGTVRWTATRADLVFGSNAELRAVAEVYASADGEEKFVTDFIAAWAKVMNLDRFDLQR